MVDDHESVQIITLGHQVDDTHALSLAPLTARPNAKQT
jgi:hypothetical protein